MAAKKIILEKIEEAGLVGRGGAAYPVVMKWTAVSEALKNARGGYIIANGAEGEPGVKKDGYILEKYPDLVVRGLKIADEFFGSDKIKEIYIFLNHDYIKKFAAKLKVILADRAYSELKKKIVLFEKPLNSGYIGGEETSIISIISGGPAKPHLRPPYPTSCGLHGLPTLMQNIETLYNIALVEAGNYEGKRFYTITGAVKKPGVYYYPSTWNIEKVLKESGNHPTFPFFVQIGGQASGEVFNSEQLEFPAESAASIMVYDLRSTDEKKLIRHWLSFYKDNSCGQCTACREGSYRLLELYDTKGYDRELFDDIVENLSETSFCALGSSLPIPLLSYLNNIKKYGRN